MNAPQAHAAATTRATYHRALLNEALTIAESRAILARSADEKAAILANAAPFIAYHEAELDKALADEAERGAA
jgi:hypothetical protein